MALFTLSGENSCGYGVILQGDRLAEPPEPWLVCVLGVASRAGPDPAGTLQRVAGTGGTPAPFTVGATAFRGVLGSDGCDLEP